MSPHPRAVKFLDLTIVCPPPHPFRFRWQIPCVGVKAANRAQLRIDSGLTPVGPIISVEKLRIIGDLPTPSLPTREIAGTRRGIHSTDTLRFVYGQMKYHCRPPKWRGRATRMIRWSSCPICIRNYPSSRPLMSVVMMPEATSSSK